MSAPILQLPSRLEVAREKVRVTRKNADAAIFAHVQAVLEFQALNQWQEYHGQTWEEFCLKYPEDFYKPVTYRQKKMDLIIANMIISIVADATPTEAEARRVRVGLNKLTKDSELKAQAYAHAYEKTGKLVPSAAELEIAYYHIKREKDYGVVTIEGQDYDIRRAALDMAIAEEILEKEARKSGHIDASMGIETKRAENLRKEAILAILQEEGYSPKDNAFSFTIVWKELVEKEDTHE